ncbi:MAG: YfcE family phosphodiesterase [Bacteroidetes bacterium]|nr:MAG: YfcE family phosphodiesterase [Bacteroidota bacterium]
MKRIGLLSDTHGYLHPRVFDFMGDCDEIWHAGDIGNMNVVKKLEAFKPLRAVYGNIDGGILRTIFSETAVFTIEKTVVAMIHIGGYPGRYTPDAKQLIAQHKPNLFISGHSHILKVIPDKRNNLLHINPGAAGKSGFHQFITMVRFTIDGNNISDMEVFESKRG